MFMLFDILIIKIIYNGYLLVLFFLRICFRMCCDLIELFINDVVILLELKRNMFCYCEKFNE